MPLTSKLPLPEAEVENVQEYHDAIQVQPHRESCRGGTDNERDSGYGAFDDDECLDSDMEGSVINRPRPKKSKSNLAAPTLPQRSGKRTSMILDNVIIDLKNLDGTRRRLDQGSAIGEDDPHETYLSSEEEASFSDDDEGSILDLDLEESNEDSEESKSRPSSRRSQEDTARMVSIVMVGKPQIVDIFIHSPRAAIQQRHTLNHEALNAALTKSSSASTRSKPLHRPSPLNLSSNSSRRFSIASNTSNTSDVASANATGQPAPSHSTSYIYTKPQSESDKTLASHSPSKSLSGSFLPRKSSRIASNLSLLVSSTRSTLQQTLSSHSAMPLHSETIDNRTHSFLNIDPFEAAHYQSPITPSPTTSRSQTHLYSNSVSTPKTPTGSSSSSWKMSRNISRTLHKTRKPSMPKINLAYTHGVIIPRNGASTSRTSLALSQHETKTNQSSKELEADEGSEQMLSTISRRSATMPVVLNTQHTQEAKESKNSYENILQSVINAPPPPSFASQEMRKGVMGAMMGLGRRKSIKVGRKS